MHGLGRVCMQRTQLQADRLPAPTHTWRQRRPQACCTSPHGQGSAVPSMPGMLSMRMSRSAAHAGRPWAPPLQLVWLTRRKRCTTERCCTTGELSRGAVAVWERGCSCWHSCAHKPDNKSAHVWSTIAHGLGPTCLNRPAHPAHPHGRPAGCCSRAWGLPSLWWM